MQQPQVSGHADAEERAMAHCDGDGDGHVNDSRGGQADHNPYVRDRLRPSVHMPLPSRLNVRHAESSPPARSLLEGDGTAKGGIRMHQAV